MLKSQVLRIAAFVSAGLLSVVCAPAQNAAAPQGPAPATKTPQYVSSPQLTVRGKDGQPIPTTVSADGRHLPDAQRYIEKEFGPGYVLDPNMPVLLGDLDGDGQEDAVFVVKGGNPMVGSGAFNYTVLDPYDGYWSFGDPMLNTHVTRTDPGPHYNVLVAHDWLGEKTKAKFVFINLPFKQISLTPTTLAKGLMKKSKTVVAAIATVETDGQQGAVFWNGRTYKFVQLGNVED